jgi:hypothetical protein
VQDLLNSSVSSVPVVGSLSLQLSRLKVHDK